MQKTKKSKFIAIIAAILLCLPLALLLTACGGTKKQVNTNSKEMYALSAISSAIYLQHEQNSVEKSMKAVNLAQTQTPINFIMMKLLQKLKLKLKMRKPKLKFQLH